MSEKSKQQRRKGIRYIICGLILFLSGFLVGTRFVPSIILKKTAQKVCVDSAQHSGYGGWIGSLTSFSKDKVMKITYWNITNKQGFLFNGELPLVKEVGPYIYQISTAKKAVSFSSTDNTVKFKSLLSTRFDPVATKAACPTCNENDKLTVINAAYTAMMMRSGGDKNFAYGLIPTITKRLLETANLTIGSMNKTLEQFGNFSSKILPSRHPVFPLGGFASWLTVQNNTNGQLKGVIPKLKRAYFNVSEMLALYNVIKSPSAMGTTGNKTLTAICTASPTIKGCGYIFYLNVFRKRQMQVVNASTDPVILAMKQNIQQLFCPSSRVCLTICPHLFKAICDYVTLHLASLSIQLVIDGIDFGPVMTRTAKQLSHGFVETRLRIPGIAPNGFAVAGFLPNHSENDVSKVASRKMYTCASSKALQFKDYADSDKISQSYYPKATEEFRRIEGYARDVGVRSGLKPCCKEQPPKKKSYTIFDTNFKMKMKIVYEGPLMVGKIFTNKYSLDTQQLLKINNISVFKQGLIDLSSMRGMPMVASMPYFLDADKSLIERFKMKPNAALHKTYLAIEPVSGRAFKISQTSQMNIAIPEVTVQAPRRRPFNISYTERQGAAHYGKVIPLFWIASEGSASASSLESFATVYKAIDGACASIVIGPLLGGLAIVAGIIFIGQSCKPQVQHLSE